MSDRLPLLILSFLLMLQNVCSSDVFSVSEPFNHTLNIDGSVSVTCRIYSEEKDSKWDAKLLMDSQYICDVEVFNNGSKRCDWEYEHNTFKFTLKQLEAKHKDKQFSCEISRVQPIPIMQKKGKKSKLFQGFNIPFPPPARVCICPSPTPDLRTHTPTEVPLEDTYRILILGLIIVVILVSLYSIILTAVYIRLRITKLESSDTLIYVPMQRKVKQRDADNTEYMDMREVQKRGGSTRDMNHNSHPFPPV